MNECARLLSPNRLPDLEEAISPKKTDENHNGSKTNGRQPQHSGGGGRRRSWMAGLILVIVCVAAIILWNTWSSSYFHDGDANQEEMAAVSETKSITTTTTTESTVTPPTMMQDNHNVEFPTRSSSYVSAHSSAAANKDVLEDAYVISFSNNKTSTSSGDTTKRTSIVPVAPSYALDNPYMSVGSTGKACINHFECQSKACGLNVYDNKAKLICCSTSSALWTNLPKDGTFGFVCTLQANGAACNQNALCASGYCQEGICQEKVA